MAASAVILSPIALGQQPQRTLSGQPVRASASVKSSASKLPAGARAMTPGELKKRKPAAMELSIAARIDRAQGSKNVIVKPQSYTIKPAKVSTQPGVNRVSK
jgi:hypothetical protein